MVTLHSENATPQTVSPTRVVACQPDKLPFSQGTATALAAGPAAVGFVYRLPKGEGTDLCAVCYVTVVTSREELPRQ